MKIYSYIKQKMFFYFIINKYIICERVEEKKWKGLFACSTVEISRENWSFC